MTDSKRATDDVMKHEIIIRLALVWQDNPELRLMQLIRNVFRDDPYYVEDYEAIKMIEEFYRSG